MFKLLKSKIVLTMLIIAGVGLIASNVVKFEEKEQIETSINDQQLVDN